MGSHSRTGIAIPFSGNLWLTRTATVVTVLTNHQPLLLQLPLQGIKDLPENSTDPENSSSIGTAACDRFSQRLKELKVIVLDLFFYMVVTGYLWCHLRSLGRVSSPLCPTGHVLKFS